MPDMNIRNIDPKLLIEVKTIATTESRTLREVVTEALERFVEEKRSRKNVA